MTTNQERLTKVIKELFPDRPPADLELAIRAGRRALERGEPFFDSVVVAEDVLNAWWDVDTTVRNALIAKCKLTEIRRKL